MERGFSMLEILIALSVLMSAFTVTLLLSSSQSFLVEAKMSGEALTLARESLELEQALARKDFNLVVATTSVVSVGGTPYAREVVVTQSTFFIKKVTVTVRWLARYGRSPQVSLVTFITNFSRSVGGDTCSSVFSNTQGATGWKNPMIASSTLAGSVGDSLFAPYSIADIDVYENRLYVVVATSSSPMGPNSSSAVALDSSVGTIGWNTISNAQAHDAVYATATFSSGETTQYIEATRFGFSIPQGATILGIKAEVERKGSSTTNLVKDGAVRIVRANGVLGATNKADSVNWPTSGAYKSYGDAADLWGEGSWSPAEINDAHFGVAISATSNGGSGSRTASIDHIRITVYYTKQFYILDSAHAPSFEFLGGLATSTFAGGMRAVVVATSTSGSYAYVALNSSASQLEIIDVSNPRSPFVRSLYTVPGGLGTVANTLFYANGYVYLGLAATGTGVGKEFHIIDVSTPASPREIGYWPPSPPSAITPSFNNNINAIFVRGGYAYLATPYSPELIVLNVVDPANPFVVATYDAPDTVGNGKSLYPMGDALYLGRTVSSANPELLALDTSDLSQLQVKNATPHTWEVGSSVLGIIVRDSLAFLLTTKQGSNPGRLQIFDTVSAEEVGTVVLPGGATATGVALDCEGESLFVASVDALNRGYLMRVDGL